MSNTLFFIKLLLTCRDKLDIFIIQISKTPFFACPILNTFRICSKKIIRLDVIKLLDLYTIDLTPNTINFFHREFIHLNNHKYFALEDPYHSQYVTTYKSFLYVTTYKIFGMIPCSHSNMAPTYKNRKSVLVPTQICHSHIR